MRHVKSLLFIIVLMSVNAQAQWHAVSSDREGRWESGIGLYLTSSEQASGLNESSIDVDSGSGFSLNAGYNFTHHLALHFDAAWFRADYDAVLNTDNEGLVVIDHRLSGFNGQLKGVWNILDTAFTPYVDAGIGWTYLDSNVSDGAPSVGCWWDPWWGYICSGFYSTYSGSNFSWSVGAGLRYELRNRMFVRGGWERSSISGGQSVDPTFDVYRVSIGWLF